MNRLQLNLAYLIAKADTNPNALSQKTNVPQSTIQRALRGTTKQPRLDTIEPLAKYFGVSLHDLLNEDLQARDAAGSGDGQPFASIDSAQALSSFIAAPVRRPGQHPFLPLPEIEGLRPELSVHLNQRIDLCGRPTRVDYLSDTLAVDLSRLTVDSHNVQQSIPMFPLLTRRLWNLSTLRLLTRDSHASRQYYVLVHFEDRKTGEIVADVGADPSAKRILTALQRQATLHGIHLVFQEPALAAPLIEDIELGLDLIDPDFLDLGDDLAE
ncbi:MULTISPECIES: helix-turn-helix domain-containing protein [Burkholderia]|uniref:Helix-turn-helix domain-containing protein n=1 Tax=Burkholderia contaminans TaxID=488447 RepID=A0A2S5DRL5_9BURK|nr:MULTISPECIES: helix-turn-helix transcriptional regulator [Burkholderia]EKS9794852.1 helix-turn-helix domain-containing protein [Burkholderia cepacia]EKS9802807.1 helix-turn-helix domain-containing protein [Burkholderia cepacia]EKS9809314.1 helix-turn-helix domain-containing protein [Burkholderia cepacia]EKS9818175.1 helix-turn-helix domain-containing protein [Burkholderia cepacia]EKS9824169.1 helix-turn-helix domain-containing protein [Burkholderia cepacia]